MSDPLRVVGETEAKSLGSQKHFATNERMNETRPESCRLGNSQELSLCSLNAANYKLRNGVAGASETQSVSLNFQHL